MKLYLVQHGDAVTKEVNPERPLSERGIDDINRLARLLERNGIRVNRVLHSGKLRAEQTAQKLVSAIAPDVELEVSGLLNPNDSPAAFDWQSESWDQDTLIIGHLPFLGKLVAHLLSNDEHRFATAFQPGSIVCLEHNGDGRWQLNWMLRPELILGS